MFFYVKCFLELDYKVGFVDKFAIWVKKYKIVNQKFCKNDFCYETHLSSEQKRFRMNFRPYNSKTKG